MGGRYRLVSKACPSWSALGCRSCKYDVPRGLLLVAAAALASKLVSLPEFLSRLLFFLFLLHPVSVSVVLLVRAYLLFAACSCLKA